MNISMHKIFYYENVLEFKENTKSALQPDEVRNWQLCRTCLTDSTETAAYSSMSVLGLNGDLILMDVQDMLNEISEEKLLALKNMPPTIICKECINKIIMLYFFKKQVKRADAVLIRLQNKLRENVKVVTASKPCEAHDTVMEAVCSSTSETEETLVQVQKLLETKSQQAELKLELVKNDTTTAISDIDENEDDAKPIQTAVENSDSDEEFADFTEDEYILEELPVLEDDEEEQEILDNVDNNELLRTVKTYDTTASSAKNTDATASTANFDDILITIETADDTQDSESSVITRRKKQPKLQKSLLENLTCNLCHETFEVQRLLVEHVHKKHPNTKAYKCRECGIMFAHLQSLSRHMQTHKPVQYKNVCDLCGKMFLRSDDWKRHRRVHTNERPYSCDVCPKAFKQHSELKEHKNTHISDKTFVCNICGHRLSSRNGLYIHKKAHDSVKNFGCSQCAKRFRTSGELKSHAKVHLSKLKG